MNRIDTSEQHIAHYVLCDRIDRLKQLGREELVKVSDFEKNEKLRKAGEDEIIIWNYCVKLKDDPSRQRPNPIHVVALIGQLMRPGEHIVLTYAEFEEFVRNKLVKYRQRAEENGLLSCLEAYDNGVPLQDICI